MTTAPGLPAPGAVSPWLPTAPCTPGRCAVHPGAGAPLVGPARAAARLAAGLGTVLVGVLCTPLTAALPAAARAALVRRWARAVLRAFGVRVHVHGRPAPPAGGPALVVANHVSWLDIPLVAAVLPGRMLAKQEVRGWPVLGPLAARGGTLFLDRDRLRALPGAVRRIADVLARGSRVVVFPEGSTWCGRAQGRFRPAAFQAALDAGAAVQPVRLAYTPTDPAAFVADDPLAASLWRIARTRGLTAGITVLPPIPSAVHPDRRTLARAAEHAVRGRPVETTHPADTLRPVGPTRPADATSHAGSVRRTDLTRPPGLARPVHTARPAGPVKPADPTRPAAPAKSAAPPLLTPQRAVASDRANRPSRSVHHWVSSRSASASSARTPS